MFVKQEEDHAEVTLLKKKKKGKNKEKQGRDGCCHRRIDNIVKKSQNTSNCHSSVFSYIDHIFKDFSKNMNVCVVRSTCIGEENMLFNVQPSAAVVQGPLKQNVLGDVITGRSYRPPSFKNKRRFYLSL